MSSLANVSSGNILDVITIDDVKLHKTHWAYMCLSMACTVPAPLPSIENWAEILKAKVQVGEREVVDKPPIEKKILSASEVSKLVNAWPEVNVVDRPVIVRFAYPQRDIDFYLVRERSLFNLSFNVVTWCLT